MIDLAVGVIIGGAFGKIVTSLVNDIIMPLLGLILGKVNFTNLKFIIVPATEASEELLLNTGILQSVVDFLIIALSIFLMIKLLSVLKEKEQETTAPRAVKEELLLAEIRTC